MRTYATKNKKKKMKKKNRPAVDCEVDGKTSSCVRSTQLK